MNEPVKVLGDSDLERYLRETTIQAESMRLSIADFNEAKNDRTTTPNVMTVRMIAAAQGIINAAMAVTRLLWPNPASKDRDENPLEGQAERQRQWTLARGKTLRKLMAALMSRNPRSVPARSGTRSSISTNTSMASSST